MERLLEKVDSIRATHEANHATETQRLVDLVLEHLRGAPDIDNVYMPSTTVNMYVRKVLKSVGVTCERAPEMDRRGERAYKVNLM